MNGYSSTSMTLTFTYRSQNADSHRGDDEERRRAQVGSRVHTVRHEQPVELIELIKYSMIPQTHRLR
jgi:hypothetical protein